MTSRIKSLIVVAAAGIVAALSAQAAEVVAVKANVPFDFVVADRHIPAGEYWFVRQGSGVVRISSGKLTIPVMALCVPTDTRTSDRGRLIFKRYGSQRFLNSIQAGAVSFGAVFPTSRSEKEWSRPGVAAMIAVAVK